MLSLHLGQGDIGATPRGEHRAAGLRPPGQQVGARLQRPPADTATRLSPPAHPSQADQDKYNQAKANQADLQRKQQQLTAESNFLRSQQASLERQEAQLRAEKRQLDQRRVQLQQAEVAPTSRPRPAATTAAPTPGW
jgi:hypothetical protein